MFGSKPQTPQPKELKNITKQKEPRQREAVSYSIGSPTFPVLYWAVSAVKAFLSRFLD